MNMRDYFPDNNDNTHEYDTAQRVKILGISEKRQNELKKMEVKEIPSVGDYENSVEEINTDNIIGVARATIWANTWWDMLSPECCHKNNNFKLFNIDTFDKVLLNPDKEDYPSVIETNKEEYYISGNGLHRLTIAKCLGNKKAVVVVERKCDDK